MPRNFTVVACVALASFAALLPAAATGAVRSKLDSDGGMRFRLDGRVLTVAVADRNWGSPGDRRVVAVRAMCATSFDEAAVRRDRRLRVVKRVPWRYGETLRVRFGRDLSARVRWCLVEDTGSAGDLGFVSFLRGERPQRLAAGTGPDGQRWRLSAWRGERAEPCVRLVTGTTRWADRCFYDEAGRDAGLDSERIADDCPHAAWVAGVAPRATARVDLLLDGGGRFPAQVLGRPRGSRVHATFFLATPPLDSSIRGAEAIDAAGTVLGREHELFGPVEVCDEDE